MASSIQERLKLKQYQVDTWTTREQLCLASAVMRSGDQNWVAVRRNIKMLTNETSRPPDWYSTKNCALQYARLLERVDTPKRKRERGDGGNETPGEIVTKMLSKQRVEELRALEAEEKATYNQLRKEIQQLESGKLDNQLDTFWEQLVKEHAQEEEEEQRQQQWLKEREEKITAIQQALKHQGPKVPQPPHKKKPKLQVGGCGSVAESRRSSGLSETSSEVDSAVESPDQNEVTPESLVSNKLAIGSRTMRSMGISPVSEALQNLVSSAISGTNTSDKDKSTPTASSSGTSTLSLLLDLPPSTPGGPLPRLNDLPGPSYESREQEEKKSDPASKNEKMEESCSDNKGCAEQVKIEEIKPAEPVKPTESTACTPGGGEDAKAMLEVQKDVHMEEKRKEVTSEESKKEDEKDKSISQTTTQKLDEASESKNELKTSHNEEKEKDQEQEQGNEKKIEHKEEEKQKKEVREDQEQNELNKEESPKKLQEKDSEIKEEKDCTNERPEGKKIEESGMEENKIKTEEKSKEPECSSEEKNEEHKTELTSSSKTSENVAKVAISSAGLEQKDLSTTCTLEEGNRCTSEEAGCEKNQEKTVKNEENKEMEEEEEEEEAEEEEKEEEEDEEATTAEARVEKERDNKTESKEEGEEAQPSKKSTEEEEEEPPAKLIKTEENALSSEGEKKPKKIVIKKEQEEDPLENQDSKDWVSEEEGSTFGSRKRKISGGENIGSSSPLISESTPNSPASTHYGDDSENERAYKSWKKPIMILWNDIAAHKFASLFLRPITDDQAPGYHSIVYRPMDLQKIKRNIESGAIRTTAEFQRDIMLMFLNATMYNTRDHNVYHMAHQMMKDAVSYIQNFLTTQMLVRAEETPQKSLRRETRESSAKRSDDDSKRKRDPLDEKSLKKRRTN
ncbi:hypothetical protein O3P69_007296 [Scylla paramamosain]|uniref:Bromo domain-containing protein n=1 Tax=Scylla paramamosain TaxID=85552 RepID=A0AAW0V5A3_SCYPA